MRHCGVQAHLRVPNRLTAVQRVRTPSALVHRVRGPSRSWRSKSIMEDMMPGFLASRTHRALQPSLPYFKAMMDAMQRPWSEEDPEGYLLLMVAENKLTADLLKDRFSRCVTAPVDMMTYNDFTGLPRLRAGLAALLERTFMKGITVDPDHLVVSCGVGAVLDQLFFTLCDAGQGVIIPAPYYPAFDNDLQVRDQAVPVPVHLDLDAPIGPQLDRCASQATEEGHPVRALLLSNPNNPTGELYPHQVVVEMLKWCLQHKVHLVSDEIYGLSVFGEGASFKSTAVVAHEVSPQLPNSDLLPDLLHVVFGMSKDFCASGLRVGCLYTRNPHLKRASSNLAYFTGVSFFIQWAVAELMEDHEFLEEFIRENNRRLRKSYDILAGHLSSAGIPFIPACSAMFCFVDLRAGLREKTWEGELELWNKMAMELHLLLTPGHSCHAREPGWFRVCYAWMPPDCLPLAVEKMKAVITEVVDKSAL